MNIELVHRLAFLDLFLVLEHMRPLVEQHHTKTRTSSRNQTVHSDLVGGKVVVGDSHSGACIHEKGGYEDD